MNGLSTNGLREGFGMRANPKVLRKPKRSKAKKGYSVGSVSPVFRASVFIAGNRVQTTICSGIRYVHKTRKQLDSMHIQEFSVT